MCIIPVIALSEQNLILQSSGKELILNFRIISGNIKEYSKVNKSLVKTLYLLYLQKKKSKFRPWFSDILDVIFDLINQYTCKF